MANPDPERFKKLPEPVQLDDVVETHDVDPHAPDNTGPVHETEWMLRNSAL